VDTPDGENCGLVKNLALLTKVTTASEDVDLIRHLDRICLKELGLFSITDMNRSGKLWLVVVNGKIAGGVCRADLFVNKIKELRRNGAIDRFVSVFADPIDMVIDIWSDGGRLVRPLINLEQLRLRMDDILKNLEVFYPSEAIKKPAKPTSRDHKIGSKASKSGLKDGTITEPSHKTFKDYLVAVGVIEYLDVNELNNCNIAFTLVESNPSTTHIEISQDSLLGIVSSTVPFPHHNQSPRNTLQCAMGKQALGLSGLNQLNRIDTVLYQLVYPQRPFVETRSSRLANYHRIPAGQNAMIVVMSYSGFDIEDAVIVNKASIERGLGRAVVSRKYMVDLEKLDQNKREVILPYHRHPEGIVDIGEKLDKDAILVNKHLSVSQGMSIDAELGQQNPNSLVEVIPQPVRYKSRLPGAVHNVMLSSSGEKYLIAKMSVAQVRVPEVGDKFSSRHGQKGVMSIKVDQTNLPFSESGWMPDIIMNPHGFPSRMTIGKLLELVSGKAGALDGKIFTTKAFEDKTPCPQHPTTDCNCKSVMDNMGQILQAHGYEYMGTETLISGTTGEYLNGYVFSGPVFYQRLKHLVADKIHARARGKKTFLTRQPLEGRAKEGGLRLGEMERDCLVAYGASELLLERFLYSSDLYYCPVCEGCGLVSCNGACGSGKAVVRKVKMPYPFKLLLQELMAMNITPRILLK
jgi:DNA-directed RNA polymerase III subunit RPC2